MGMSRVYILRWSDGYDIDTTLEAYLSESLAEIAKNGREGCYIESCIVDDGMEILSVAESRIRTILCFPDLDPCVRKLLEQAIEVSP